MPSENTRVTITVIVRITWKIIIIKKKKSNIKIKVCLTMSLSFLVREYNAFSFKLQEGHYRERKHRGGGVWRKLLIHRNIIMISKQH